MKTEIPKNLITNLARNDYDAAERWLKTLPAAEQQTLKPTLEKNRMKVKPGPYSGLISAMACAP